MSYKLILPNHKAFRSKTVSLFPLYCASHHRHFKTQMSDFGQHGGGQRLKGCWMEVLWPTCSLVSLFWRNHLLDLIILLITQWLKKLPMLLVVSGEYMPTMAIQRQPAELTNPVNEWMTLLTDTIIKGCRALVYQALQEGWYYYPCRVYWWWCG